MDGELRILIIEDVPSDAELLEYELQLSGLTFIAKCVRTKTEFLKELDEFFPHIVLSDYSLPSFDGPTALKISVEKDPYLPFIVVSGAIGEEIAVEMLKKGATDYVLKNHLSHLAPVMLRALKKVQERHELRRIESALKESKI